MIYESDQKLDEGQMSLLRSALVSEKSLSDLAASLDLGRFLFLGPGEEASGGRSKPSILADALEALFAAAYFSDGLTAVKALTRRLMSPKIAKLAARDGLLADHKTRLQVLTQSRGLGVPKYAVLGYCGPDNDRVFSLSLTIPGWPPFKAEGRSKKEASQLAAKKCLAAIAASPTGIIREDVSGKKTTAGVKPQNVLASRSGQGKPKFAPTPLEGKKDSESKKTK